MSFTVNHTGGLANQVTGNTAAVSDSWTSTTGSTIIAIGHLYNTGTNPEVSGDCTDSKSNTYTLAAGSLLDGGTSAPTIGVWYNIGGTRGATHTVSLTPAADASGTSTSLSIIEISPSGTCTYDSTTVATASDATSPFSVTAAAAISGTQIAIYGVTIDAGDNSAMTAPTGYTNILNQGDGTSFLVFQTAYKNPETGTPTVGSTRGGTIGAAKEVFVTFSDSGGGGGASGTVAVTLDAFTSSATGTINSPLGIFYVKEIGFVTDTTAGTTSAITVATGGAPIGDTLVIYGSCDNTGASGAATTIAVADNSNNAGTANTYTLQTPQAIADPGAASAGQQGFLVVSNLTRSIDAADTITITFGNSTAAKAINCQQFTGVNQTTPVLASSYNHQDNQTGQAVSVATGAGPTRNGQVVCALVAVEGGTADAFTEDTDTTDGAWHTLTRRGSGTTTSGATLNSVYKQIQNTGTPSGQTYNGTTMLGTARDHAAAILVLDIPPTSGTVAQTLATFTPAITATEMMTATSSQTLAAFTCSASGTSAVGNTSSAAVTLDNFTSTATGTVSPVGSVAVTLAAFTTTTTATETITGTVAVTLAAFTSAITGVVANAATGTVAVTLDDVVCFATDIGGLFAQAISSNRRYLVDQHGDPYFLFGTTPQLMPARATTTEMGTFFTDQAARGVNFCQVHLVAKVDFDENASPNNVNGDPPYTNWAALTGRVEAYWAHIDTMFDLAELHGITLQATVADNISYRNDIYPDWTVGSQSFAYGQFLGTRYKDRPNLIWAVGNDWSSGTWFVLSPLYLDIIAGIRDSGDTHLTTLWLLEGEGNDNSWDQGDWVADDGTGCDVILAYTYTTTYAAVESAYTHSAATAPKPVFMGEASYQGEHNGGAGTTPDLTLRKIAWWTITSGGFGHVFGQYPVEYWDRNSTGDRWDDTGILDTNAAHHLALIPPFMTAFDNWHLLVPDTGHVFQTGGRGTHSVGVDPATNNYASSAFINGGTLGIAYFPTSRASITFDTTKLSGTVTAYWWDPTDGSTSTESNPAAPTHPGNNTSGDADWVLVLQGTPSVTGTVAVTLAAFTSTATAVEKMTATSAQTLANFTSTASGTSVISGTSAQTLANFTGAATGTETISGTSAQTLANYTGAATGTETITGTESTTLANFTSTASGIVANGAIGTVAQTLADYTGAASGTVANIATSAQTLADFTGAASGLIAVNATGTVAVTLDAFTGSAAGQVTTGNSVSGSVAVTLANFTGAAAGTETITGSAAITITLATSQIVALEIFTAVGAVGLIAASGSATGTTANLGTGAPTLANFTAAAAGTENITGAEGAILAPFAAAATGTIISSVTGTSAQTLQNFTAAASGTSLLGLTGTCAVTLQNFLCFASDLLVSLPHSPSDQEFILIDNLDDTVRLHTRR